MQYVIGVDIGTGSTKAVAVRYSGEVIAASQFYYPGLKGPAGYDEQDPEVIWLAFVNAVKETIRKLASAPAAISLSSCMHSLMAMDADHLAITNLITWADTRSEEIAGEIRRSPAAEHIYKTTGTPIHSMSPLCKITWLRRNLPEIFSKTNKFISIKEFIWHRLFNVYEVDYSIASATGLFDIEQLRWNDTSLVICGITPEKLSDIVSTKFSRTNISAAAAASLSLPGGVPVCIGASDGCLANVGSHAVEPGIAAVTIGTSGAVRIANSTPVFAYEAMTFNYVLDEETFICGGPVNNGGNTIKWLFKSFLNNVNPSEEDYGDLFRLVDSIKAGANGLLFLPYLHGERAPVWDERACGVFFGIKEQHRNAHFLRAVLEGICYTLNQILQQVESSSNAIRRIHVSGGFIRSGTWMQILADITGKKLFVIQTDDASAIGAALFYIKAMSIDPKNFTLPINGSIVIEPQADNSIMYKKYFAVFKNLYAPLKESMHQLHNLNS